MRLPWDNYFIEIARAVSLRASCPRLSVGAVVVRLGAMGTYYIASTGYNGAPAKQPHCLDVGCDLITLADGRQHCRRAEHAERNAFYHASANGFQLANGCLYIWGGDPCGDCMRAILAHNLQRVVTVCLDERYVNKDAERIFGGLGIPFLRYTRSQWLARGLNE